MGTLLNFKPILELRDGRVEAVERVRTRRKSLSRIVELVVEQVGSRTPVRLASLHANAAEDAQIVLNEATAKLNPVEILHVRSQPGDRGKCRSGGGWTGLHGRDVISILNFATAGKFTRGRFVFLVHIKYSILSD